MLRLGYDSDTYLGSQMMLLYAKCGSVADARRTFDKVAVKNAYSWSIMLNAYTQNGHLQDARRLFDSMDGKNVVAWTVMLSAYAKNGYLQEAMEMFSKITDKNVICWTAMITAYTQAGYSRNAIQLFRIMQLDGTKPSAVTFVMVLDACGDDGDFGYGKIIHAIVSENGYLNCDIKVGNSLISMYGECHSLKNARLSFESMLEKNVISWTALITAYAHNGHLHDALHTFREMLLTGESPNDITFIGILDVCAANSAIKEGKYVHAVVSESASGSFLKVGNSLINMYGKFGQLEEANKVFDGMQVRNVVTWSAMITANAQRREAFMLFRSMLIEGILPNIVTFITILDTCAKLSSLSYGKFLHSIIKEAAADGELDYIVATALVTMYGRCGCLQEIWPIFYSITSREKMAHQDSVIWSAVIAAFTQNGRSHGALELFHTMQIEAVKPDVVTFMSVLAACSQAGLVTKGIELFVSIQQDYGLIQVADHYDCMIDLMSRAGYLAQAEDLIENMPFEADHCAWTTLLNACRARGDTKRGQRAAENLRMLDPQCSATYVLLSNAYTS